MIKVNNDKNSIIDIVLLLLFLIIYEFSATIYSLPNNDLLRWIVCLVLVIIDIIFALNNNGGKFQLLPKEFSYLIFPLFIQSFWNLNQTGIALSRSISFLLYSMAIYSLFHRPYMTPNRIKKLFDIYFGISIFVILPLNIISINRMSIAGDYLGIYNNRNMTTSVMLSIFIMLGIILKRGSNKKILEKVVIVALTVISIYLNFITHSRMAIIGITVASFMLLYYSVSKKNGIRVIFIGLLAIVFIYALPFLGEKFRITSVTRILSAQVSNGSTGLFRNDIWSTFVDLVGQKPLLGWGNNSVYYNTFVNPQGVKWGVHNSYYVMLIEGGIVGTLFYGMFFASSFRNCLKDYKECIQRGMDKDSILLIRYCLVTCISLAINAFAESFLFSAGNVLSLPFWFSLIGSRVFLKRKRIELEKDAT